MNLPQFFQQLQSQGAILLGPDGSTPYMNPGMVQQALADGTLGSVNELQVLGPDGDIGEGGAYGRNRYQVQGDAEGNIGLSEAQFRGMKKPSWLEKNTGLLMGAATLGAGLLAGGVGAAAGSGAGEAGLAAEGIGSATGSAAGSGAGLTAAELGTGGAAGAAGGGGAGVGATEGLTAAQMGSGGAAAAGTGAVAPAVAPAASSSVAADLLANRGVQAVAATGLAAALADKPEGNSSAIDSAAASTQQMSRENLDWADKYITDTILPQQQANTARSTAAGADAQSAATQALEAQRRDWARMGYTPSSNMRASLDQNSAMMTAANVAQSANAARFQAQDIGHQRVMEAAGLGRQVSSDANTSASTATSAGTSAAGVSNDALRAAQATAGVRNNAAATSLGGQAQAANAYAQSGNQAISAANSRNDLIGTVAGTAAGYLLNQKK
jgi:hypothetical protein